jgi:hypothetical protein
VVGFPIPNVSSSTPFYNTYIHANTHSSAAPSSTPPVCMRDAPLADHYSRTSDVALTPRLLPPVCVFSMAITSDARARSRPSVVRHAKLTPDCARVQKLARRFRRDSASASRRLSSITHLCPPFHRESISLHRLTTPPRHISPHPPHPTLVAMQLISALPLFAAATAALAIVLPAPATRAVNAALCSCPRIGSEFGTAVGSNTQAGWYQCAYQSGACMWNVVRIV